MCGFAGRVHSTSRPVEHLESIAARMNECIRYRGPNGSGVWLEPSGHTVFAFSRLAIQDLSADADQPMHSESCRYVIAYNGEIYNLDELRRLMGREPASFRTHSDTEVLLASIEKLGLEQTLQACNGMFAIALWDRKLRMLSLARDRFGEKPLHYALTPEYISFASEIKSILALDEQPRRLSLEAVEAYFALTYVPGSLCIFKGIHKVKPGHILEISANLELKERCFWNLEDIIQKRSAQKPISCQQVREETNFLLKDSVDRRLISDVPVGILLSGGTDSSLVAFTVAKTLGKPIQTFTIGLEDAALDESSHARSIATKLGVENECLILTNQDALRTLESLVQILDEPLGDNSAASTFAVCQMARRRVTVLLGGDGGDEVFGGYTRYEYATGWKHLASTLYSHLRLKNASISKQQVAVQIYSRLMTKGFKSGPVRPDFFADLIPHSDQLTQLTVLQYLRYLDLKLYLPDDILVKTDRMSMANSVELRSPFLDHRLVEKSWTWPDEAFVRGRQRKPILADLFSSAFGSELLQGKKHGYHSPIGDWLRGPLREGMENAIDQFKNFDGIPLSGSMVRSWWSQLLAGNNREEQQLWNLYMFWQWSLRWGQPQRV